MLTFWLYGALAMLFFALPLDLIEVQGWSATAAGASLLPFIGIMVALSRWVECQRGWLRWRSQPLSNAAQIPELLSASAGGIARENTHGANRTANCPLNPVMSA